VDWCHLSSCRIETPNCYGLLAASFAQACQVTPVFLAVSTSSARQKSGHVSAAEAPGRRGATRAHTGRMQPRSNEAGRDASTTQTWQKL
jgi:hypothetical protein